MYIFIDAGSLLEHVSPVTEFVAFDVETTGLYPDQDRITELGAVKFNLQTVLQTFTHLVDPGQPISPDASRVSGITDEMVCGKPSLGEILPAFIDFIGAAALIAHNAPFDAAFLHHALRRQKMPLISNPIFDTRLLAKALWPRLGRYSLTHVLDFIGITRDTMHRALQDARACRDVFVVCINKIIDEALCSYQVRMRTVLKLAEDDVDQPV